MAIPDAKAMVTSTAMSKEPVRQHLRKNNRANEKSDPATRTEAPSTAATGDKPHEMATPSSMLEAAAHRYACAAARSSLTGTPPFAFAAVKDSAPRTIVIAIKNKMGRKMSWDSSENGLLFASRR